MLGREQAWAWYFDRNPHVQAVWGHQNGRWPMHLGDTPEADLLLSREMIRCDAERCWCHLEILGGGDEDAREGDAARHEDQGPR
jgi:hypothetical protein